MLSKYSVHYEGLSKNGRSYDGYLTQVATDYGEAAALIKYTNPDLFVLNVTYEGVPSPEEEEAYQREKKGFLEEQKRLEEKRKIGAEREKAERERIEKEKAEKEMLEKRAAERKAFEEKENFEKLSQAVEQKDIDAHFELGLLYLNGQGVAKDSVKGKKLIKKAAKQGSVKAKEYIKICIKAIAEDKIVKINVATRIIFLIIGVIFGIYLAFSKAEGFFDTIFTLAVFSVIGAIAGWVTGFIIGFISGGIISLIYKLIKRF